MFARGLACRTGKGRLFCYLSLFPFLLITYQCANEAFLFVLTVRGLPLGHVMFKMQEQCARTHLVACDVEREQSSSSLAFLPYSHSGIVPSESELMESSYCPLQCVDSLSVM